MRHGTSPSSSGVVPPRSRATTAERAKYATCTSGCKTPIECLFRIGCSVSRLRSGSVCVSKHAISVYIAKKPKRGGGARALFIYRGSDYIILVTYSKQHRAAHTFSGEIFSLHVLSLRLPTTIDATRLRALTPRSEQNRVQSIGPRPHTGVQLQASSARRTEMPQSSQNLACHHGKSKVDDTHRIMMAMFIRHSARQ